MKLLRLARAISLISLISKVGDPFDLLPSTIIIFTPHLTLTCHTVGKAFRHGDIENTLLELVKVIGHSQGGGGLLGFAQNVLSVATGGAKFSKEDVKHVYFVSECCYWAADTLCSHLYGRETGSETTPR